MEDLSSLITNQTHVPYSGSRVLTTGPLEKFQIQEHLDLKE